MLKRLLVPVSALLLALFLSGCFLLPKEADPPELPLVTPFSGAEYSTAVVTRGDLVSAAKVGFTFSPTRRENLHFSVLGRSYGAIYVTVGAQVEAGQLLAELESSAEQAAIHDTETELERLNIRLDTARSALDLALEEEQLQGSYSTVVSDARRADISYYEASIAIQEQKLEEQRAELEALRIYAPIDGTVTYVKSIDQNTRSGKSDTVVTVTDTASGVFTALTDQWALFPEGEQFVVDTDAGQFLCVARDPAIYGIETGEKGEGLKNVCLEILDEQVPQSSIRGEVRIVLEVRENVIMLPTRAVFTVGDRYYVYHEDASGLKSAQEIGCGLSDGSYIEITEGLEEGEYVIVS
jgi:macrolide-specific efflux system membrane fusion protein